MAALGAEEPGCGGAEGEGKCREGRGKTECGEAGASEVEECGQRERVVSDSAMGKEMAHVWNERGVAGDPEAVDEGDGCGDAEDGEGGVGCGDPAAGGVFGVGGGVVGAGGGGGGGG